MALYANADPGVWSKKTFFNKGYEFDTDINFGVLNIVGSRFVVPGDIWKLQNRMLLRFQPQWAPFFTPITAKLRYWFVPLRLLEENTELIITGSKNGKLWKSGDLTQLPVFDELWKYEKSATTGHHQVKKGGICEQMFGLPTGIDMSSHAKERCTPALYWVKAYYRIWFDYYRDENMFEYDDFDEWWESILDEGAIGQLDLLPVNWKKDYLTSALIAQQKGVAPVLNPFVNNPQLSIPVQWIGTTAEYSGTNKSLRDVFPQFIPSDSSDMYLQQGQNQGILSPGTDMTNKANLASSQRADLNILTAEGNYTNLLGVNSTSLKEIQGGFSAPELRILFAQQKVFERLMRCGSRYTEYLMSNFGCSPADGTLQRAQYLGGYTQPIVTSEVLQTGPASGEGAPSVGTQRGHSISAGVGNGGTHMFKEFGVLLATLSVMPKAQYTQGIDREYCLKERFDFPNPSYQFLSEDEVMNGEVYYSNDGENDNTFGFQEMYAWLKTSRDKVLGNLRGDEAYYTMARFFNSRPNLNNQFVQTTGDSANFARPFTVTSAPPIILRNANIWKPWRNFARSGTPSLIDHF